MTAIIVVALALVAAASSAYVEPITILKAAFDQQPEEYLYNFETADGTKREEVGQVKQVLDKENKPQDVVVIRGSYTYLDSEGKPESITCYADETGYHAEGGSLPKPVSRR